VLFRRVLLSEELLLGRSREEEEQRHFRNRNEEMQANSLPLTDESIPNGLVDGITVVEQLDMIIAAACECM
jgi:hypothetical protein